MDVLPSPAKHLIYLRGSSAKESVLRFVNLNGQLIKEMSLHSFDGAIQLDTDQLPVGMLVMDWRTYEGNAVSKIMISH